MTRQESIAFLEDTGNFHYAPSLARERELLAHLGNPQDKLRFVHVTGTNGKGSTCACLASVLRAAGYRTGLYTSPHIFAYEERIRINGVPVDEAVFFNALERLKPIAEEMAEKPTTFELLTAAGFLCFAEAACDIVVLEVGMGGRFDATNVIASPLCAVITAIGLDHTAQLGSTVAAIAGEKSGIIKPHTKVVCAAGNPEAVAVVQDMCRAQAAEYHGVDMRRITQCRFFLSGTEMTVSPYGALHLPLLGTYQTQNALTAITVCEVLQASGIRIAKEHIAAGLRAVSWRGRFELLCKEPFFLLDGAHNAHGIAVAVESLQTYFPGQKITFLLGVLADKDVERMLALLLPLGARFVVVTPPSKRAMDSASLANRLRDCGAAVTACETVAAGVDTALSLAAKDGVICALGSLYFSGDVRMAVAERKE